jgi:predicted transcriptional regulator of viral defense system
MHPIQELKDSLEKLADAQHYLFAVSDFQALFPYKTLPALLVLLGRAVKSGILERVCRGLYLYSKVAYPQEFLLYHTAVRLRANVFCYLSLESVLSEAGIISQIPLNCVTLMTSGRSGKINCGKFGRIEFTHTKKNPADILPLLTYDFRYKLWCAAVPLALQDWRAAGRRNDLLNLEDYV